jgi:beta-N-acetylhexosaminidase
MLDPAFASFVAGVPAPLVYGLTPGEAARWLVAKLRLDVDLRVAPLRGYAREPERGKWGPWISPSPGIRYWETAWSYPAIVPFEALPAVDFARGSTQPFQLITAPFFDAEKLAAALNKLKLPGVTFLPAWNPQHGVRFEIGAPARFRPFATSLAVLQTIQKLYGAERLWNAPGTRPEFFDQLMGTDRVRVALQEETPWRDIAAAADRALRGFKREREAALLYRG